MLCHEGMQIIEKGLCWGHNALAKLHITLDEELLEFAQAAISWTYRRMARLALSAANAS